MKVTAMPPSVPMRKPDRVNKNLGVFTEFQTPPNSELT